MKPRFISGRSFLSFELVAAVWLLLSMSPRGQSATRVTGTIEDPISSPIAGAEVSLVSPRVVLRTDSSQDGFFMFNAVEPGAYQLAIAAHGFFREELSIIVQDGKTPAPLVIHPRLCNLPEPAICDSSFPVSYGPLDVANTRLEGTIREFVGGPISNAEITVKRISNAQLAMRSRSGRNGRFTIDSIAPGVYRLKVFKRGYQAVEVKKLIKPNGHGVSIAIQLLENGVVVISQ